METIEFIDYHEIADAAENVYLRPVSKNFQSVDSNIKPAALFQVTGAHKHPCKQKGLHDVLSELGNPTHPRLYFVVPPDRFTSFRYQPYLNAKGKAMREPTYVNGKDGEVCGCTDWQDRGVKVFNTPPTEKCKTVNPKWIEKIVPTLDFLKKACPTTYTYPYDDMTSTFVCGGEKKYRITFCPMGDPISA
ncbi:hypothetical protein Poli38472_013459 [Pythium oligandrum]|uniref:Uncharacterized protein n=1 Tax=Pythium oligandrum TaxID=41045 RepID=A0A8K1C7Q3_PYTOL|nr:hypothetical protein Poli38472_013459 [Pythium oligandrum]|eukprot:TMW57985.1 hypothetical protein Poli38472_013459 [Pythium oligandrum]